MPVTLRKRHGTSRSLCRSKPYDKRASLHQSSRESSPLLSDGGYGGTSPTLVSDTVDKPGFLTYDQYKRVEAAYLGSLSPVKRGKALISQSTFDMIWDVLDQPDAPICTAQFRFWVRKMFTFNRTNTDSEDHVDEAPVVILHNDRPVAVQEQLYEVLCYCHEESDHGGRDRTFAVIRQHYSWVPKELTALFVKACPTCTTRRNDSGLFKLPQDETLVCKRKEEQVGESTGSLCQHGSLKESYRSTGGQHDESTMQPDRTADVVSSRNNRPDRPSTCLPSFKIPGASSKLLSHSLPSLLNLPSQDLSDMHSRQMVVNFSRKGGLPPLISDVASSCSHSDVKLPSLSDAYWDDSRDDQYKLNDLWPENISDSLPPELQRFQLTSPVRTQHTRNEYIDPAQLILANPSEEKEDWMNEVYLPSHYSPQGSIIVSPLSSHSPKGSIIVSPGSSSSGSPDSVGSRSPSPSFRRDLGSLCQRLGLTIPIQSHDGLISPDALSLTLLPVPPLMSPITSPITPPSDEGTFDETSDEETSDEETSDEETSDGYSPDDEGEDYEILIGF